MLPKRVSKFFGSVRIALEVTARKRKEKKSEGVQLLRRLEQAEKAFPEAYKLVAHLERKKDRERLARILKSAGYDIRAKDLKGAYSLIEHSAAVAETIKEKYGLKSFPIVVVVPWTKWDSSISSKGLKDKLYLSGECIGTIIQGDLEGPLKSTGIAFVDSRELSGTSEHEALHQVEKTYKEKKDKVENLMIGEIFSEMNEVKKPSDWISMVDEERWGGWIKEFEPDIKRINKEQLKYEIRKALQALAYLELKTSPSIVAQVILNARNLKDIYKWKDAKLKKYESEKLERRSDEMFCRDVVRTYSQYRRRETPSGYKKMSAGYIKREINKYNLFLSKAKKEEIVEEEYQKQQARKHKR